MLNYLFGFNARLGRLNYFFATIALAVVMTVICFLIAGYAFHNMPRGAPISLQVLAWPAIVAGIFFLWASFTLQSMRIRDIGWDPVCVIPAWIALLIIDHVVAGKFPMWSIEYQGQGTMAGAAVNLVLFLALLFWPAGDFEAAPPRDDWQPETPPRSRAAAPAADRIARVSNGEFGRRAG